MYIYYLLCFIFIFLYVLDFHNILISRFYIKYNTWTKLNNMVSIKHKNYIFIIWFSIKLILQALYINLIQYLNKSLIMIDKNTYELTYIINGTTYKNRIKIKKGPKPVLQISDECSEDITDKILPYLGPSYDFNGSKLTPKIFGYKTLTFEMSDGNEKFFDENDIIEFIF